MSIDALPTGFRQQGEKNTFSLNIHVHNDWSACIKKMYFFIGYRKFMVANKYNVLKKVSHTFWVIKPNDAGG